jgi:K+-transporting ATPase ATPase C chain
MRYLKQAMLTFVAFTVLCGLVYPLFITLVSQLLFPQRSNGSMLTAGNNTVGSELIGQRFDSSRYFYGRPSSTDPAYNASGSAGSNRGPSNAHFLEEVKKRVEKIRNEKGLPSDSPIPADLVLASASGLDPHISVEAAMLQVRRISLARGISVSELEGMVRRHIEHPFWEIWGQSRVNVLKLNLALDAWKRE